MIMEQTNDFRETLWGDFLIKHKVSQIIRHKYHIHEHFEIMLILSDNAVCRIGEKQYPLAPHTMLLFNNMDLHYITLNQGIRYNRYILHFKPEFIEYLSSQDTDLLGCFFFRPFQSPQILPLEESVSTYFQNKLEMILLLQESDQEKKYGHDLEKKFRLGSLLLDINRLYREYHNIESENSYDVYSMIYPIINHIHKNLTDELTVEQLAKAAGTNQHTLCSSFKKVTGISPHQYVIKCRMIKAKDLLERGVSVKTVCTMVGYSTLPHFSRAFKKDSGLSPKEYSMKHRH